MNVTKCDECGAEISAMNICPFCKGDPTKHAPVTHFGDDPIEDYIDTNLGHDPVHITTRGQRRAMMSKQGIEYKNVNNKKRLSRLYFFT